VALHGYVLMGNHYHLMLRPVERIWAAGCTGSPRPTAFISTDAIVRVGHLFQGRYKSIVVEAEGYLLSLSRYVHLNPVRGKIVGRGNPVERRRRLRNWRWSSYREYSGLAKGQPWVTQERVLGEIGGAAKARRLRYRRFVEEGLLREIENPLEGSKKGV